MDRAIQLANLALNVAPNPKVGCVIVHDDKIIGEGYHRVCGEAHAEVNAIRQLTKRLGNASLSGDYTLYTTCEPCAMCAATCIWAGIQKIVYGVGTDDFSDSNPNLIEIRCEEVLKKTPQSYSLEGGLLRKECKQLHEEFPLEDL